MTANKKHPATVLVPRSMTKLQFKKLWRRWRSLDAADRINELSDIEWSFCWFVERNKFECDQLLKNNLTRVLTFEYANLPEAA